MSAPTTGPVEVKPCTQHTRKGWPYLTAHLIAEARLERGDKQTHCVICGLWLWPEEIGGVGHAD